MTKIRMAGYIRVSSPGQVVQGYSLDAQERAIREYVATNNGVLVEMYRDEGLSARTASKRDAYLQMRTDAGKHKFDALVVHKFDRLNRNKMDARGIKALLRKNYKIQVLSVTEDWGDDPIGQLIESIFEGLAEYFSANLSAEIKKGRREIAEQGLYFGAVRPFGYARDKAILTPHEAEAPILRMIFEDYATGEHSFKTLVEKLNAKGVKTTKGTIWKRENISFILNNPLYIGKLTVRDTTYTADNKRVMGEPVIYQGVHEPLISQELYDSVQAMLSRKLLNHNPKPQVNEYLLQGLCYCGACLSDNEPPDDMPEEKWGKMYVTKANRYKPGEPPYEYYRCPHKHNTANVINIDQQVVDFLLRDDLPTTWKDKAVQVVWEGITLGDVSAKMHEYTEILKRMDERWDMGYITDRDEFIANRAKIDKALSELAPLADDGYERAVDLVYNFKKHWLAAGDDRRAQRELVSALVERVFIVDKKVSAVQLKPGSKFVFLDSLVTAQDEKIYYALESLSGLQAV